MDFPMRTVLPGKGVGPPPALPPEFGDPETPDDHSGSQGVGVNCLSPEVIQAAWASLDDPDKPLRTYAQEILGSLGDPSRCPVPPR